MRKDAQPKISSSEKLNLGPCPSPRPATCRAHDFVNAPHRFFAATLTMPHEHFQLRDNGATAIPSERSEQGGRYFEEERVCEECGERFWGTSMNGKPAVMLAHHSNKSGRRLDGFADSSNARGSSALTDGALWVSEMRRNELGETSLEMTKVNGAAWAPTLWLKREKGGTLRAATSNENIAREAEREAKPENSGKSKRKKDEPAPPLVNGGSRRGEPGL